MKIEDLARNPIGVFDSGYGGLTILEAIRSRLPQYDYMYLGDNARAPYGTRSFDVVYEFTRQAVSFLFSQGCPLVILGCNTASAKALRTIQQHDLPQWNWQCEAHRRVLGVIRPTAEIVGDITKSRHVGILATEGTIRSESYRLEIEKLFPDIVVTGQACPVWVTLVEAGEANAPGTDYFVRHDVDLLMARDPLIDTVILGCTHYPLLLPLIRQHLPSRVRIIPQGSYVAASLADYLRRHTEIDVLLTRQGTVDYLTTESPVRFSEQAGLFLNTTVSARHVVLQGVDKA